MRRRVRARSVSSLHVLLLVVQLAAGGGGVATRNKNINHIDQNNSWHNFESPADTARELSRSIENHTSERYQRETLISIAPIDYAFLNIYVSFLVFHYSVLLTCSVNINNHYLRGDIHRGYIRFLFKRQQSPFHNYIAQHFMIHLRNSLVNFNHSLDIHCFYSSNLTYCA